MKIKLLLFSFILVPLLSPALFAQSDYRDYDSMTRALQQLEQDHSGVQLESIASSPGGHDIWKLTLGTGDIENKPAMVIVGGVDGAHILGIELALKTAETLLSHPNRDSLFENHVFHIFPNLNPDASEQFFSSLKYERSVNARETDLDRDGQISEDGYDDLNNDGLVTMMRVEDPTGNWMPHPDESRVLIKADPLKNQTGRYHLFSEGIDRDKDGQFNEDPPGGVNINKNFTYQYPSFEYGAGEYPVSEDENRALLDLLFDSFNVYAVFTFSPNNNLSDPWTYNRSGASQRVITSILEGDAGVFRSVSDLYKEIVPQENASGYSLQKGGFPEWAYFHYARYSFTTDGWWVPKVSSGEEDRYHNSDNNKEVNLLHWADREGLDLFTNWEEVDHPDFPGQKVEVGGIHPFAMTTPPYSMVDSLNNIHTEFITELADKRANLVFENIRVEEAGRNLTRITIDLHNEGLLPTSTQLGTRTLWVRPINIHLNIDESMEMVSGRPHQQISRINGGESQRITWLLHGSGSVSISAGTPSAGFANFQQTIR